MPSQFAQAPLQARKQLLAKIIRARHCRQRQAYLAAPICVPLPRPPSRQCNFRHDQRCRLKARPVWGAAPFRGKRKATQRHRPPTVSLGGIPHRCGRHLAPALRHQRETLRAGCSQVTHLTQCRQRGPPAVRLLEHEPRLTLPTRGAHHSARVHLGGKPNTNRRQDLFPAPTCALDRKLQALQQPLPGLVAQLKRRA